MNNTVSSIAVAVVLMSAQQVSAQSFGPGEVYFGLGVENVKFDSDDDFYLTGSLFSDSTSDLSDIAISGIAGYRINSGVYFYGSELDVSYYTSGDVETSFGAEGCDDEFTGICSVNWTTRLRGIAGYDLGPAEVFGAVGAVWMNVDTGSFDGPGPGAFSEDSETVLGYSVGIGGQYAVTNNMSLRLEVIRDMFSLDRSDDNYTGFDSDFSTTTARAAAIFTF